MTTLPGIGDRDAKRYAILRHVDVQSSRGVPLFAWLFAVDVHARFLGEQDLIDSVPVDIRNRYAVRCLEVPFEPQVDSGIPDSPILNTEDSIRLALAARYDHRLCAGLSELKDRQTHHSVVGSVFKIFVDKAKLEFLKAGDRVPITLEFLDGKLGAATTDEKYPEN